MPLLELSTSTLQQDEDVQKPVSSVNSKTQRYSGDPEQSGASGYGAIQNLFDAMSPELPPLRTSTFEPDTNVDRPYTMTPTSIRIPDARNAQRMKTNVSKALSAIAVAHMLRYIPPPYFRNKKLGKSFHSSILCSRKDLK